MRFEPRAADDSVNVSDTHPLAEAGTLLIGLVGLLAVLTLVVVFAVELLIRWVPVEKEVALFSGWAPVAETITKGSSVAETTELMQRLALHWEDNPYTFRLEISDDPNPNAMALPGGLIIVTQGLLDTIDSENALALVIGHELGHFRHRDHIRQLGRVGALSLFFSAMQSSGAGSSISYGIADLTLRGFSREQERAADDFGLTLVQREYGHIAHAFEFFEAVSRPSRQGVRWDNYLGTHPDPVDRIERLKARAIDAGWSTEGASAPWPPVDEQ